jgi:hypothetical protein
LYGLFNDEVSAWIIRGCYLIVEVFIKSTFDANFLMVLLKLYCKSFAFGNEYATFKAHDEKVPYFFPTGWGGGEGTGWVSPFTQLSHDFGFLPHPPPLSPLLSRESG